MHLRRRKRRRIGLWLSAAAVAGLLAVTAGSAFGLETPLTGALTRTEGKPGLVELRDRAREARAELRRATEKYEEGRDRLEEARQRLESTRRELERTRQKLEQLERPIAAVANATYQHPAANSFASVVTSRRPQSSMRAAVDFAQLTKQQQEDLRELDRLLDRRERLVKGSENLASTAKARAEELRKQRRELKKQSGKQTDRLVGAMRDIGYEVSRGERLPLDCDPAQAGGAEAYPNGLLPESVLCPLPQDGEHLRADAAVAFGKLSAAYTDRFGKPICVTDSYRSLAAQQTVYATKPGLAAVPGTSNHGLGLALDLCGGINAFGSAEHAWMQEHAPDFGWLHPDWAGVNGSRPEPWHWEYKEAEAGRGPA